MPGNFGEVSYDPNAFLKGATAAQAFNQLLAQNKAASVFDPKDTSASQEALNGAGLYDQANKLADRPNEVRSDQLKVDQQQQTLDQNTQTAANDQDKAEWEKVGQITDQLIRARDGGQDPSAVFDQMRPMLQSSMGLDPAHADEIANQLRTNPQFLDVIHQQALGVAGSTVYDKTTGKVVIDGTKTQRPQIITKQNADGSYSAFQVVQDDQGVHLDPVEIGADGQPVAPAQAPAGAAPAQGMTEEGFAAHLQQIAPGAKITSGLRDAATNARVGGVPNSGHLIGISADAQPPAGMSYTDFNKLLQAQGFRTLPEKGNKPVSNPEDADHIHVDFAPRPGQAGAATAGQGDQYKFGGKPATAADASAPVLGPEDIDYMAEQYATYGPSVLTSLGNNKAASTVKQQIIGRARELYGDQLDASGAAADYKANQSSLSKVTQSRDASQGFERATNAAADLVRSASDAGFWPTPYAPLNEATQAWMRASGDPRIGAYDTAVNTLAEEYAKVMTGANGNAAATEGARQTAHERLNTAHTRAQADAIIKQMKVEMQARIKELSGNVEDVRTRTRTQNSPVQPGAQKEWTDDELDALLKGN